MRQRTPSIPFHLRLQKIAKERVNTMMSPSLPRAPSPSSRLLGNVSEGFRSLQGSPRELWQAYALKFLDSFSYFSFSIIFTLFLSSDFGYDDVQAGTIYGAWGALITVYGLFAGMVIDNIGVAKSLRLGFVLSLVARVWIFCTTSRTILLFNVCGLLPLGNCLGIPVLSTGIRRYTNEKNRGFAFGVFYVVMNVAALLSGPLVDACTIGRHDEEGTNSDSVDNKTWTLSGYRLVVLSGILANIVAVVITFTVREIKTDSSSAAGNSTSSSSESSVSEFVPLRGSAWSILRETIESKRFWRFLVVCLFTINVKMIFRHLDATLPKYMVREFGENVPKGTIYSINPALIIILVPIISASTSKTNPLLMIHHGSYISAASVFLLALSTSIPACIGFVTFLSIGEAIWSPRLYDYMISVSKEGREGTYAALASAPLFLAKLPVGFMSGFLLERYCPEEGPRESKTMWLIIGLTTAISPVLMTLFWSYISHEDSDDEDAKYTELPNHHQPHDNPQSKQDRRSVCATMGTSHSDG